MQVGANLAGPVRREVRNPENSRQAQQDRDSQRLQGALAIYSARQQEIKPDQSGDMRLYGKAEREANQRSGNETLSDETPDGDGAEAHGDAGCIAYLNQQLAAGQKNA